MNNYNVNNELSLPSSALDPRPRVDTRQIPVKVVVTIVGCNAGHVLQQKVRVRREVCHIHLSLASISTSCGGHQAH